MTVKKGRRPPMQPIAIDEEGVARFRKNDVVDWLATKIDLDCVATAAHRFGFDPYDVAQFWQMLGYSISGYGELSFIPKSVVRKADEKETKLLRPRKR